MSNFDQSDSAAASRRWWGRLGVTVGAVLGMAAHLEGKACTVMDQTGMAQKGGAVTSHLELGDD